MDLALPVLVGLPRTKLVKSRLFAGTEPLPFEAFTAPVPTDVGESTLREQLPVIEQTRSSHPSAISTRELLERAAALGPGRMTWESIALSADPILEEKRQPHVAERRARFTRMVKIGLGGCLAVCVVALGVSALSSEASAATPAAGNTVPAQSVVPVEKLGGQRYAKTSRHGTPLPATAALIHTKRR